MNIFKSLIRFFKNSYIYSIINPRLDFHIDEIIGKENTPIFLKWALGENYNDLNYCDTPEIWNKLHSDLFIMTSDGNCKEDLKKMIKAWIDSQ